MRKSKWLALGVAFAFAGVNFTKLEPVKANPALLAPAAPALCSTGVGCVLVAAVVIGGVTYYLWETNGKRLLSDINGNTQPEEYDPGKEVNVWDIAQCQKIADQYGKKLITVRKEKAGEQIYYVCVFDR
ncbi:hypothetical protein NIES4106_10360 [Fischerella sp. NIES-4106]|nr:hypothetical protein NIES4106_10360 [Fischerella sp. NIES-4106]